MTNLANGSVQIKCTPLIERDPMTTPVSTESSGAPGLTKSATPLDINSVNEDSAPKETTTSFTVSPAGAALISKYDIFIAILV